MQYFINCNIIKMCVYTIKYAAIASFKGEYNPIYASFLVYTCMHACINQFQWFVAYVPTYYIFKGKGGYFKLYSTIVKYTP